MKYDYPHNGAYNETVATLDDGRRVTVNTQYSVATPEDHVHRDCSGLKIIGGVCDCGALNGIDLPALIVDARVNGKFGEPPKPAATPEQIAAAERADNEYDANRERMRKIMGY